jgi:hypothetical protein
MSLRMFVFACSPVNTLFCRTFHQALPYRENGRLPEAQQQEPSEVSNLSHETPSPVVQGGWRISPH